MTRCKKTASIDHHPTAAARIQQQPLGQTTTTDTSVMDRRVDVVLYK